jgi:hypothetical protein
MSDSVASTDRQGKQENILKMYGSNPSVPAAPLYTASPRYAALHSGLSVSIGV